MYPSIRILRSAFPALTADGAQAIRDAMRQMTPSGALDTISNILGLYGVEHIARGHNLKSPAIDYCNTGDPYNVTMLYVRGRFRVGSWGDIVERGHYD